jgi:hypothetical protein
LNRSSVKKVVRELEKELPHAQSEQEDESAYQEESTQARASCAQEEGAKDRVSIENSESSELPRASLKVLKLRTR